MARTTQTSINISVGVTQAEPLDLGSRRYTPTFLIQKTLTDGTGADQSDMVFFDQRTVSSSPDDIDLQGVLTDQLGGGTLTFADVTGLGIYNKSSSYQLYLYTSPSNGLSWLPSSVYPIQIRPGGWISIGAPDATGLAVGASADNLRVASATGASVDYYLMVTGRSA